jgi:ribonuclease-3
MNGKNNDEDIELVSLYNPKNILIMESDINKILNLYGVTKSSKNVGIYQQAMVHKSYITRKNDNFITGNVDCPDDCLPLQECSNERVEFLGDAVLGLTTAEYLYDRYPDQDEGFLTKMRSKLVNWHMLGTLCEEIGLNKWVIISRQIEESTGRTNIRIMEDLLESFICAIYKDLGFINAKTWIIGVMEEHVDFSQLIRQNKNYKDQLTKYLQHIASKPPRFFEGNVENINGRKQFTCIVKDGDERVMGIGTGESKKLAEQMSSQKALEYLGQFK